MRRDVCPRAVRNHSESEERLYAGQTSTELYWDRVIYWLVSETSDHRKLSQLPLYHRGNTNSPIEICIKSLTTQ